MSDNINNYNYDGGYTLGYGRTQYGYAYKFFNHFVIVTLSFTNTALNMGLNDKIGFVPVGYRPNTVYCALYGGVRRPSETKYSMWTYYGAFYVNPDGGITQNVDANLQSGSDIFCMFAYPV